jgi:hypothetical protein
MSNMIYVVTSGRIKLYKHVRVSGMVSRIRMACKDWVCGTVEDSKKYLTTEEKIQLRKKMTSLEEKSIHRKILNIAALLVAHNIFHWQ